MRAVTGSLGIHTRCKPHDGHKGEATLTNREWQRCRKQTTAEEACEGMRNDFEQIADDIGRDQQIEGYKEYVERALKANNLWP